MNNFTKTLCILLSLTAIISNAQIPHFTAYHLENGEPGVAGTGSVRGRVFTTDNKPASDVSVLIKEINRLVITDQEGGFIVRNIRPGIYTISISMMGLVPVESKVTIRSHEVAEVSYALQESSKQLEEVIVSTRRNANKTPVAIGKIAIDPMDLPQSIAVVGQGIIRDQQAAKLSDVIRNVNGVYLSSTRGNSQETFSARGYGFSSSNMFKNGARVNAGAMPEMSSIEKVEVLKGSAAILYGNVAPGGIINMITKQPKFNFGGEVSMRAGSYDLYKPAFDVYGPLSEGIAYRVNGTFETANSFREVVHSKKYYVNPSFLFKLGKRTELLVQGDYLHHTFTPDFGIGTINNTHIASLPRSSFLGTPWAFAITQQSTASVALKHQLNDAWKLNLSATYQNYSRDYYSVERIQADSIGNWARSLNRTNTNEDYYVAQVDLTGSFKTGSIAHSLLAGIDADRYNTTNYTYNQPTIYDTINILDPSKFTARTDMPVASRVRRIITPINRVGAYIQDLISLTDKLKLLAGVRLSYQNALPIDSLNVVNGTKGRGVSRTDQAFSPRVGLVYRPTSNTSLFASYSNSFTVNSGTDIYFNALAPSLIDQFEIGIKKDFFKGRLSSNLTAYRIRNNNLAQTAQFAANGLPSNNTAIKELTGETTSDGVEVDITGHPVAGLDIIAGYSYNYMRYTKTANAKGNYVEGERLVNSPAHTANASIFCTFKDSKLRGLKVGATAFYTGNRFGGWNNTIGQTQNYSRLIAVGGFTTVDISAGYTIGHVSLLAKVSNLANTYNYYVHENYSINPIAPRQLIGTLSYKF